MYFTNGVEEKLHLVFFRDIAGDECSAPLLDLLHHFESVVFVNIDYHHEAGAFGGKSQAHGAAYSICATGDHHNFVLD
jgi:hypothetical protein